MVWREDPGDEASTLVLRKRLGANSQIKSGIARH